LGVTQQAISVRLRAMRMIQKQGNWVLYELKLRDIERRFFTYEQLIQRQQRKGFFGSDCDWRSGYSTITLRRKKYAKPDQSLRPQHQHHG